SRLGATSFPDWSFFSMTISSGAGNLSVQSTAWSVVLAGGEGTRLRDYVERRFGESRPKQYCAFSGRRTMLQHTVDRGAALASPARTITVVTQEHLRWARPQLDGRGGELVVQPFSRDTCAGVYLPLAYVRARDPGAVV